MARAGARGVRVELGVVVRWSRGGGRGRGLRGDRAVRVWSCGVCGRGVSRAWGGSSAPGQGQRGGAEGVRIGSGGGVVVRAWCALWGTRADTFWPGVGGRTGGGRVLDPGLWLTCGYRVIGVDVRPSQRRWQTATLCKKPIRKKGTIVRRVHARVAACACVVEPGGALQFEEGRGEEVAYLVERGVSSLRVFSVVHVAKFTGSRSKGRLCRLSEKHSIRSASPTYSLLQLCADFLRVRRLGLVHTPPNPSLPRHTPPRLPTRTPQQRGRRWQYGRRWSPRRRRSWPLSTHGARGWPWRRLPRAA